MIRKHTYVGNNFSNEQIIWKYYSLEHFLWLIHNKALYFGRADEYEDKREILASELHAKLFYNNNFEGLKRHVEQNKPHIFLNCWTMSKHESILMWRAYSNVYDGIVIKTSIGRLMDSYSGDVDITIGKVDYIDENTQSAQPYGQKLNWLYLVFSKLWFYSDEKEMRLYFSDIAKSTPRIIPVDINVLIEEIHIAPKAKNSLFDTIRNILKLEQLDIYVCKSEIEIG